MILKPTGSYGWIDKYIAKSNDENLIEGFKRQTNETLTLLSSLTDEQWKHSYAPGKWTIAELVIHLMDTERVFGYRALTFSRGDQNELPGYDENIYAANCDAGSRSGKSIMEEYIVVRTGTVALFSNLPAFTLDNPGVANKVTMSARALGWATLGHEIHHVGVMRERYL
jgi:hypothetical protein